MTEETEQVEATDVDKAGQNIGEAEKSKEEPETETTGEEDPKPSLEVLEDTDDSAQDQQDDEEVELTDEEKAKIERVLGLVNDRCFIMHHCMEGAVSLVLDVVDETIGEDKRAQAMESGQFAQFGPMPPQITQGHILSTAGMLATKIYESIVPQPKPKQLPNK